MHIAPVKRRTLLGRFARIWWREGSEGVPVSLAIDPGKFVSHLEELHKWREFRVEGDAAAGDLRQAKLEAGLARVGSSLRDAQADGHDTQGSRGGSE